MAHDVADLLRKAAEHLAEHNGDYHHRTPSEFIAKLREAANGVSHSVERVAPVSAETMAALDRAATPCHCEACDPIRVTIEAEPDTDGEVHTNTDPAGRADWVGKPGVSLPHDSPSGGKGEAAATGRQAGETPATNTTGVQDAPTGDER